MTARVKYVEDGAITEVRPGHVEVVATYDGVRVYLDGRLQLFAPITEAQLDGLGLQALGAARHARALKAAGKI